LLGISKRGDSYVRKLLIHGARVTLRWVGLKTDRRIHWLRRSVLSPTQRSVTRAPWMSSLRT